MSLENYKQVVKDSSENLDVDRITKCFYGNMFSKNPSIRAYFNQSHQRNGNQTRALAQAVCDYARNIDNLDVLLPAVNRIAHKHCAFGITPDLYAIVGENLLNAIKETHDVSPETLACWEKAYTDLANIFINLEKEIYEKNASREGGWEGYKEWTVAKKVVESDEIVSLYFSCDDPVPVYKPGQYLTIKNPFQDEHGVDVAPRNYSISDWSSEYLRISVKHETGEHDGISSTWIHKGIEVGDKVAMTFPTGDFHLLPEDLEKETIVLVAGGIGITAILSMYKYLAAENFTGKVILLHSVRSRNVQSHKDEAEEIANSHENFSFYQFITRETGENSEDVYYGRIELDSLSDILEGVNMNSISVKTCGTYSFMESIIGFFVTLGVRYNDIAYEYFSSFKGTLQ